MKKGEYKHSIETRKKISIAMLGKKNSGAGKYKRTNKQIEKLKENLEKGHT